MSDCKSSATLGCHDSWKQQVSTGDVLEKIALQSDVRLAQKCAGATLWLSTRSRPDLSYCVSRTARIHRLPSLWERDSVDFCLGLLIMVVLLSQGQVLMVP